MDYKIANKKLLNKNEQIKVYMNDLYILMMLKRELYIKSGRMGKG